MKDLSDVEDARLTLDLKHCRVSQCRFEDVKRQHVFLIHVRERKREGERERGREGARDRDKDAERVRIKRQGQR